MLRGVSDRVSTAELSNLKLKRAGYLIFRVGETRDRFAISTCRSGNDGTVCIPSVMVVTKIVPLKVDHPNVPAESGFAFLDESGDAYKLADELKDFIESRLKKFSLRKLEQVSVRCKLFAGKVPSDWEQRVHDTYIDLAKIAARGNLFMTRGEQIVCREGCFQPYILLAGLGANELIQM